MIDEDDLRRMSPEERACLARALVTLNVESVTPTPISQRRRRILIAACLVGVLVLAVWIGVLEVKLPRHYQAGGWRAAWVGFDMGLLLVFAATAWAAWRRRQMLIACLMVLATLLFCDAWFDTTLDWGTHGFTLSLLSALVVELPLAVLALIGARRLIRLTAGRLEMLSGVSGPVPPFWRVPLFGEYPLSYRNLLHRPPEPVSAEAVEAVEATQARGVKGAR